MKHYRLLTALLPLILSTSSLSQECEVKSKKDWEKVEIKVLEELMAPDGYEYKGEWILKGVFPTTIDDLSEKQIKKIKQHVAENQACIVYVDFNGISGSQRGVYYVWTNEP